MKKYNQSICTRQSPVKAIVIVWCLVAIATMPPSGEPVMIRNSQVPTVGCPEPSVDSPTACSEPVQAVGGSGSLPTDTKGWVVFNTCLVFLRQARWY